MTAMPDEQKGERMSFASRCIQPMAKRCSFPARQTNGRNKKRDRKDSFFASDVFDYIEPLFHIIKVIQL